MRLMMSLWGRWAVFSPKAGDTTHTQKAHACSTRRLHLSKQPTLHVYWPELSNKRACCKCGAAT